ncbi:hypothetical protein GOODEAATRI_021967 [Goodea atripinnis]|uniref:Uncharacterized protein n=1 Tax=Goodea atripinnis TaxID=208336 RepID=A0ABV0Q018_9TELE
MNPVLSGRPAPADSGQTGGRSTDKDDDITKMNDTLQSVAFDVSSIKQATAELNNTVMAMQAQERIAHLEEASEQLLNSKESKDKQTGTVEQSTSP